MYSGRMRGTNSVYISIPTGNSRPEQLLTALDRSPRYVVVLVVLLHVGALLVRAMRGCRQYVSLGRTHTCSNKEQPNIF